MHELPERQARLLHLADLQVHRPLRPPPPPRHALAGRQEGPGGDSSQTRRKPYPPQILWEDPPVRRRELIDPAILTALRSNPGRWARVKTYSVASAASTAAGKIRKGALGPGFEARGSRASSGSVLHLRSQGLSFYHLGQLFGVSSATIKNCVDGRTWAWLQEAS